MSELKTKDLKKWSKTKLEELADQLATKMLWLHSTGKHLQEPERYKRLAGELYHVAALIEEKESLKQQRRKNLNK